MARVGRRPSSPRCRGGLAAALALALVAGSPGPVRGQPADAQRAAAAVARIGELEEELRRLRGRVEALEAERDQLRGRLERLQRELDGRLAALEGGRPRSDPAAEPRPGAPAVSRGGAPATAAAPSPPPTPAPPQTPAPPARPSPPTTAPATPPRPPGRSVVEEEGDLAARRGYVLGTIPREAILGTEPAQGATAPGTAAPGPGAPGTAGAPGQQAARTPPTGPAPGGPTAAGRYAAARELLQRGEWPAAEDALRRYLEDFPNDPQAPTAAYWLGETYLVREDWQNAAATFARNYRTWGAEASRAPDNLLKLGVALARLGDKEKACQTFAELDRRHPGAAAAVRQALARERVAAGCS
jgi:tol-pal system protein YbgF